MQDMNNSNPFIYLSHRVYNEMQVMGKKNSIAG